MAEVNFLLASDLRFFICVTCAKFVIVMDQDERDLYEN
jgi:hypothetical protein